MSTYAEVKGDLLRNTTSRRPNILKGVELSDGSIRDLKPFQPCICVTEPCPCDILDDVIVWLPKSARIEKTGTMVGPNELTSHTVDPDDKVLVEVQIPMTVGQLRKLKEWSQREDKPRKGTATAKARKPVGVAGAALAAFEVGFALGTKIDEGTGLSDTISDWAAENIPWPF